LGTRTCRPGPLASSEGCGRAWTAGLRPAHVPGCGPHRRACGHRPLGPQAATASGPHEPPRASSALRRAAGGLSFIARAHCPEHMRVCASAVSGNATHARAPAWRGPCGAPYERRSPCWQLVRVVRTVQVRQTNISFVLRRRSGALNLVPAPDPAADRSSSEWSGHRVGGASLPTGNASPTESDIARVQFGP
jgi:hypothetical protein